MTIRAIFFDFDGVLHLSFNEAVKAYQEAAKKLGLNVPKKEEFALFWGRPWPVTFNKFWPGVNQDAFHKAFIESGFQERHIVPEANKMMSALKEKKYFLALVSSRERQGIKEISKRADFDLEVFDYIQGIEDSLFHKPDSRVFSIALNITKQRGIDRKEVVYIGDMPLDFKATVGAGIQFAAVLADPMRVCILEIAGIPKNRILRSINDLPDFLKMAGK